MRNLFLVFFLTFTCASFAQQDSTALADTAEVDRYLTFFTNTDPLLEEESEDDAAEANGRKKKRKKKVFYGIKTKKGYAVSGYGKGEVIETYHYLKEFEQPNPYVRRHYWFDVSKGKVSYSRKINVEYARILHGPYEKKKGGVVIESGVFYKGVKDGRWERYGGEHEHHFGSHYTDTTIIYKSLLDKERYHKGWPLTYEITYFDAERYKIKEVIPYDENGVKDGDYYAFFENGDEKEHGIYAQGKKVGKWYLYQPGSKRPIKKRITEYPKTPTDTDTQPVILQEWDEKGKLILQDGEPVKEGDVKTDDWKKRLK